MKHTLVYVTPPDHQLHEAVGSVQFGVRLDSVPSTSSKTLRLTTAIDADIVEVEPVTLSFDELNCKEYQYFTLKYKHAGNTEVRLVAAADPSSDNDSIEVGLPLKIMHNFRITTISVPTIVLRDLPVVPIYESMRQHIMYICLDTKPTRPVLVSVQSDVVHCTPSFIPFDWGDYNEPVPITLNFIKKTSEEGNVIQFSRGTVFIEVESEYGNYSGVSEQFQVTTMALPKVSSTCSSDPNIPTLVHGEKSTEVVVYLSTQTSSDCIMKIECPEEVVEIDPKEIIFQYNPDADILEKSQMTFNMSYKKNGIGHIELYVPTNQGSSFDGTVYSDIFIQAKKEDATVEPRWLLNNSLWLSEAEREEFLLRDVSEKKVSLQDEFIYFKKSSNSKCEIGTDHVVKPLSQRWREAMYEMHGTSASGDRNSPENFQLSASSSNSGSETLLQRRTRRHSVLSETVLRTSSHEFKGDSDIAKCLEGVHIDNTPSHVDKKVIRKSSDEAVNLIARKNDRSYEDPLYDDYSHFKKPFSITLHQSVTKAKFSFCMDKNHKPTSNIYATLTCEPEGLVRFSCDYFLFTTFDYFSPREVALSYLSEGRGNIVFHSKQEDNNSQNDRYFSITTVKSPNFVVIRHDPEYLHEAIGTATMTLALRAKPTTDEEVNVIIYITVGIARIEPKELQFTAQNYDQPRLITLTYVEQGDGEIFIKATTVKRSNYFCISVSYPLKTVERPEILVHCPSHQALMEAAALKMTSDTSVEINHINESNMDEELKSTDLDTNTGTVSQFTSIDLIGKNLDAVVFEQPKLLKFAHKETEEEAEMRIRRRSKEAFFVNITPMNGRSADEIWADIGALKDRGNFTDNVGYMVLDEAHESTHVCIKLTAEPLIPIRMYFRIDGSIVTFEPSEIIWNASNWNEYVTIVLSYAAPGTGTVEARLNSEGSNYQGMRKDIATLTTIAMPRCIVKGMVSAVHEALETEEFSLCLSKRPIAPVLLKMICPEETLQLLPYPKQLNFNVDDWDQPKLVTIRFLAHGIATIIIETDNNGGNYHHLSWKFGPIQVLTTPSFTILDCPTEIASEVMSLPFIFTLNTEPIRPVIVSVSMSNKVVECHPPSVCFSLHNWSEPRYVELIYRKTGVGRLSLRCDDNRGNYHNVSVDIVDILSIISKPLPPLIQGVTRVEVLNNRRTRRIVGRGKESKTNIDHGKVGETIVTTMERTEKDSSIFLMNMTLPPRSCPPIAGYHHSQIRHFEGEITGQTPIVLPALPITPHRYKWFDTLPTAAPCQSPVAMSSTCKINKMIDSESLEK